MKRSLLILHALSIPGAGLAQAPLIERDFEELRELGTLEKPHTRIDDAQEAFDFIMADKIVRNGITDAADEEGYSSWKVKAQRLGYDGNEPVYEVRITADDRLPPYSCIFRFDSKGNDRREHPWRGCKYE